MTAIRISGSNAGVSHGMVGEDPAAAVMALGRAVDDALAELEDTGCAVHGLAARGVQERGIEFRSHGIMLDADVPLDRQPHGAIRRRHEGRPVHRAAGPLEGAAERHRDGALLVRHRQQLQPVAADKARAPEQFLQRGLAGVHASSMAIAVASPPPMQSDATPRLPPRLRSAPIRVTRMRAPDAPIGWPSAQAPPCTFTLSCGSRCSFIAAMATTAKASLIS